MRNFMRFVQYALAVVFIAVAVASAMLHYQFYAEYVPMAEKIPTGPILPGILAVIGLVLMYVNLGRMLNKLISKTTQPAQPIVVEQAVQTESSQTEQSRDDSPRTDDDDQEEKFEEQSYSWLGRGFFILSVTLLVLGISIPFISNSIVVRLLGIVLVIASVGIFKFPVWPILKVWLAKRAILFIMVPEAYAAPILRYGKLYKVIVNSSGNRREHFEALAQLKFQDKGYHSLVLVQRDEEIMWLGWPWEYKLIPPFYEHSEDAKNPSKQPTRFLSLKLRTIDYDPLVEDEYGERIRGVVPSVDTTDPIEVTAKLVVAGWVWDPEAALFEVEVFLEAVQKDIVARWRRVVSEMSYFISRKDAVDALQSLSDEEKESARAKAKVRALTAEEVDINPAIQKEAYRALNQRVLGIGQWSDEENQFCPYHPKVIYDEGKKKWRITDSKDSLETTGFPRGFDEDSPALNSLVALGFQHFPVEISDLDPKDPEMRKALRGKSEELAHAATRVQAARGKMLEEELLGQAAAANLEETAKGERERLKLEGEGHALALGSQARTLKKEPDAYAVLAANTAVEVAAGTELMVTEGGLPGVVGMLAEVVQAVQKTVPATRATTTSNNVEE